MFDVKTEEDYDTFSDKSQENEAEAHQEHADVNLATLKLYKSEPRRNGTQRYSRALKYSRVGVMLWHCASRRSVPSCVALSSVSEAGVCVCVCVCVCV